VGEVGDAQRGLEIMGQYTAGNDLMQMCYAFELLSGDRPSAQFVADVMAQVDKVAADGWACWAYSNHDVVRHPSRWNLSPAAARLFHTLLICLRGSVCIYQGEELGLPEADVAFEDLQDPYGIEFWPEFKGRDGCRTPMAWVADNANGGFSTTKPWLPVSAEHLGKSAAVQEQDPGALIHHYRKAIAFRNAHVALQSGTQTDMAVNGDVLSFVRQSDGETILCVFNLSDNPSDVDLPAGNWQPIGGELGGAHVSADGKLHLGPWQPFLAIKAK
jgi:alpha-glucosidase